MTLMSQKVSLIFLKRPLPRLLRTPKVLCWCVSQSMWQQWKSHRRRTQSTLILLCQGHLGQVGINTISGSVWRSSRPLHSRMRSHPRKRVRRKWRRKRSNSRLCNRWRSRLKTMYCRNDQCNRELAAGLSLTFTRCMHRIAGYQWAAIAFQEAASLQSIAERAIPTW